MRGEFAAKCDGCHRREPHCAIVALRGCNVYGDREYRVQTMCLDCRKSYRGLYRLHPKHKAKVR